jgi:hypothetical protein
MLNYNELHDDNPLPRCQWIDSAMSDGGLSDHSEGEERWKIFMYPLFFCKVIHKYADTRE